MRTIDPKIAKRTTWVMMVFAIVVLGHWAEHIVQALQVYLLGWPVSHAEGLLGLIWHGAADNEWLHWGYAVVMLVGLQWLSLAFRGTVFRLWSLAMGLQAWHLIEHTWLVHQFLSGMNPVSFGTAWFAIPRMELHLLYNTVVTVPMLLALWFWRRPDFHLLHEWYTIAMVTGDATMNVRHMFRIRQTSSRVVLKKEACARGCGHVRAWITTPSITQALPVDIFDSYANENPSPSPIQIQGVN